MKSNDDILNDTENEYWDCDYEEVMFRINKKSGKIYRKFYGENESDDPVPHTSRLFNEAYGHGRKISKKQYETPKKRMFSNE